MQNKINKIIDDLSKEFTNISPLLPKISALVRSSIDSNFAQKGRWDGKSSDLFSGGNFRWVQLSALTKKIYQKKGFSLEPTLLRSTSGLRKSIEVNPKGDSSIIISANRDYAAIHQFGGTINFPSRPSKTKQKANKAGYMKRKFTKAYNVTIPARPYLTLTPKDIDLIVDSIAKTITGV
jgi:phage gpG-like protein